MIFQHGDIPEHYLQAFFWANRATELGKESAKNLVAMAIDRYLVSINQKQLFARHAYTSIEMNHCFCLQDYEEFFPDFLRIEFTQKSLQQRIEWINELNNKNNCPNILSPFQLRGSPKGTILGF